MLTLVSFVFVLGVLIFIHELGHFLIAKKVGIRVETFSLGFPPNIISKKIRETTYCIGLIPLGGYVKMAGDNPTENITGEPWEFMSKSAFQRMAVILAGPLMNYVLAIVLLIGVFYFGGQPVVDEERVVVGEVVTGAPADEANLKPDDVIIAVDGVSVSDMDSVRVRINAKLREQVELTWIHEGDTITTSMVTTAAAVPNIEGGVDSVGIIGFVEKIQGYEKLGLATSIKKGFVTTHLIVAGTAKLLKQLLTGQVSLKMIGGPVFIAQQSGKEAKKGAASLFFFMALLSVNLAILNVLPIPILDGGHLCFLAIEKIRGSPLSIKARVWAQQVGMVLILGLIVAITYNDILRLIRGY